MIHIKIVGIRVDCNHSALATHKGISFPAPIQCMQMQIVEEKKFVMAPLGCSGLSNPQSELFHPHEEHNRCKEHGLPGN